LYEIRGMQAKGIEQEMNTYFMQLNLAEKKSVVEMIKTFLRSRNKDSHVSLEEYNSDIDEAMAEAARGECVSHEEVVKMAKKW
jgi:predicted transcriptional regulator